MMGMIARFEQPAAYLLSKDCSVIGTLFRRQPSASSIGDEGEKKIRQLSTTRAT
jgi:hypothetical protein